MKRRKSLNILGTKITLDHSGKGMDDDSFGESCWQDQKISVRSGLKKDVYEDTLLHEIIHCISGLMELHLNEKQVRILATSLRAVGKANRIKFW